MTSRSSRRLQILSFGKLSIALGLIIYLGLLIDWIELRRAMRNVSLPWLAISLFYIPASYVIYTLRNQHLLNRQVPFFRMMHLVVLQGAVSTFVANAAGAIAQVGLLVKANNISPALAIRSAIMARLTDTIASLLVAASLLGLSANDLGDTRKWLSTGLGLVSCLLLVVFLAALLANRYGQKFDEPQLSQERPTTIRRWMHIGLQSLRVDRQYVLKELPAALGYSVLQQAVIALGMYCNVRAFHIDVSILQASFIGVISSFVASLPVTTLGGLGVYEASTVGLFALHRVPVESSAGMMLVVRSLFYLIVGATLVLLIRRKQDYPKL